MKADTPFVLRSGSKPLAVAVLLAMQDRGLLSIDEPIATYLPEYSVGDLATLTLRHCITHTAGVVSPQHNFPPAYCVCIWSGWCRLWSCCQLTYLSLLICTRSEALPM
jgi:CubicO group peptidase (beta-lactamase class C family)